MASLAELDLSSSPMPLMAAWYEAACAWSDEANAMALATLGPDGIPDQRMVLMRALDLVPGREAVVFYTNYESAKGQALLAHPFASALFYWGDLKHSAPFPARQVRLSGPVTQLSPERSDAYFQGRPRLSQLGAWASQQSRPLDTREVLEARVAELEARYEGQPVPRPPHWGGLALHPTKVELWEGREGRLHDRVQFTRSPEGWVGLRLNP